MGQYNKIKFNTMKIKEEQLSRVQGIQKELSETLNAIGYLESQKHALLHKIKTINEEDTAIKQELETEYGSININVEDGSYTVVEKELEIVED
jgi:hypothetical protein